MRGCIVGRNINCGDIARLGLSILFVSTFLSVASVGGAAQRMSSPVQPDKQLNSAKPGTTSDAVLPLDPVRLDGNYFSRSGHRFIPIGANWVPAKAAMEWPYQWDPASIEADFAQMHDLGFNTVRLDLCLGLV